MATPRLDPAVKEARKEARHQQALTERVERQTYNKDLLKADVSQLSHRVMKWMLEGNRLETLMSESKLKDLMVTLGIATEKLLLLEGQPTQIISQHQYQKLDEVSAALIAEMKRRPKFQAQLTERTINVELGPEGHS